MKIARWLGGLLLLLLVLAATAFTIQNSSRLTDLSFDIGFFAWHLKEPLALPVILWCTLGGGLAAGAMLGAWLRGRSIHALQEEVDRARFGAMDDPRGF